MCQWNASENQPGYLAYCCEVDFWLSLNKQCFVVDTLQGCWEAVLKGYSLFAKRDTFLH